MHKHGAHFVSSLHSQPDSQTVKCLTKLREITLVFSLADNVGKIRKVGVCAAPNAHPRICAVMFCVGRVQAPMYIYFFFVFGTSRLYADVCLKTLLIHPSSLCYSFPFFP